MRGNSNAPNIIVDFSKLIQEILFKYALAISRFEGVGKLLQRRQLLTHD